MAFGKHIQAARKNAGLTQAQLAKVCGVATITIQQYERDKREPSFEMLSKIASTLSIPLWQLMGGAGGDDEVIHFELSDEQYSLIGSSGSVPDGGHYFFDPTSPEADAFMEVVLGLTDQQKIDHDLLAAFHKLNIWGQKKAIERVEELAEIPKYQKGKPPQE